MKEAEKRAKEAAFGRFSGRERRRPLSPHLLHPHLRQPNCCNLKSVNFYARLQNEVGTKEFVSSHEFSHEKRSEIFPEIFEP